MTRSRMLMKMHTNANHRSVCSTYTCTAVQTYIYLRTEHQAYDFKDFRVQYNHTFIRVNPCTHKVDVFEEKKNRRNQG